MHGGCKEHPEGDFGGLARKKVAIDGLHIEIMH